MHHYYKSEAADVVATVQEFYCAKEALSESLVELGKVFGGAIAPMRDITSHFAGGVKLSASPELDVHWRRPDEFGYRSLRHKAVPPKGITKEQRAAVRANHEHLWEQWRAHCPPRLETHDYWDRLNVNTGNLLLCGGILFEHQNVAYFALGFEINKADHEANVSAGKPTSGWINGAVEILPSEYEAARLARTGAVA
ncbi:hypothetical protein K3F44_18225 [Pseudomonas sp. S07E 245]|uniref:hypothetical protein n=1 Tax=Pseudomonas sp. S07E 245 TaxID=2866278 RepID=UPI001C732F39|nr:hypothetical protein [Pseudomonas sp. S07E 245]QYX51528.1 hypothetical protein K3F44_18225 [Pseudomonas sp. S07E 245]